jgi:hypothetical protein
MDIVKTRTRGHGRMIIQLRPQETQHHARRRRCSFAPASLHVYRRALIRRIGLPSSRRPACILDAVARSLLAARLA